MRRWATSRDALDASRSQIIAVGRSIQVTFNNPIFYNSTRYKHLTCSFRNFGRVVNACTIAGFAILFARACVISQTTRHSYPHFEDCLSLDSLAKMTVVEPERRGRTAERTRRRCCSSDASASRRRRAPAAAAAALALLLLAGCCCRQVEGAEVRAERMRDVLVARGPDDGRPIERARVAGIPPTTPPPPARAKPPRVAKRANAADTASSRPSHTAPPILSFRANVPVVRPNKTKP